MDEDHDHLDLEGDIRRLQHRLNHQEQELRRAQQQTSRMQVDLERELERLTDRVRALEEGEA